MTNEFYRTKEFDLSAEEQRQPVDNDSRPLQEIAPPAEEYSPPAPEFCDAPVRQNEQQTAPEKKRKKASRSRAANLMSNLVAGVLAVAVLSSTLTGNSITDFVELLGGNTKGVLRFSIKWNDDSYDPNDLDAHCVEPDGYLIHYGNAQMESPAGGTLDVDIVSPTPEKPAVENIVYASRSGMADGVYLFRVHCFSQNGGNGGFEAEVAIYGRVYKFSYNKAMAHNEFVDVAAVTVRNGRMTIERWPTPEG